MDRPLLQAFLVQDAIKCVLLTLINPQMLPSILPPSGKASRCVRGAMRGVQKTLEALL